MGKRKLLFALPLLFIMLFACGTLKAQTNYSYLTGKWKLVIIEVDTLSFDDPESLDLTLNFTSSELGSLVTVTSEGDSVSMPYQVPEDPEANQFVLNPGEVNEQTVTLEYLSQSVMIYSVGFLVEGTPYSYRFKMLKI